MNTYVVFAFLVAMVYSSPIVKRQTLERFGLPSGVELILSSQYSQDFSCEGRIYGYYADIQNNCEIFHVCHPETLADGQQQTTKYSFACGNQTVFDQSLLTCNHPQDAIPCGQTESFYSKNEEFGKIDN